MAEQLDVINPFDETVAYSVPVTGAHEVDGIVKRARTAYEHWRGVDVSGRIALCRRFIETFTANRDTIAEEVTRQMGKPLSQAQGEINRLVERATYLCDIAAETLADEHLPEADVLTRYIRHEPLGVVLDIAAWNYPLVIAVNVVVPAVLAGNAVILKHSSKTPLCGRAFADAFAKAGAPDNLVQWIVADHAVTDQLVRHPGVDYVSFTGSTRGGHEIVRSASDRFIDIGLELGGKDPAYVCADAPFDYAVENCVDGAFYNAGQSCCAIERIYVDRSIYDNFIEAYAAVAKRYVVGDPMNSETGIGPLASSGARTFLAQQIDEAVANGGRLIVDPKSFEMPGNGWFAAPAVVANAPTDCSLMVEESFGPVIGITPVDSDEEAIRLMNDSAYGLTASIWTTDVDRATRIGERIETGTFYMNRCDYCDPGLPWTGVKDTGRGCSLSKYGLLQLTRLKSMHLRPSI